MPLDLTAVARAVIAIDSRSSVTDKPLVDVLLPLCRQTGLLASVQEETRDGERQFNLVALRRGTGDQAPLLLNTHLDTVPPGDEALWTACDGRPFDMTIRDGSCHGLGVADVKLDFVCKLLALERLRDEPLARPVVLAGSYGEETGRWGAKLLARELRPRPALALVGEPTSLRPCLAHKGYLEVHVQAKAPAHGAFAPAAAGSSTTAGRGWRLTFAGAAAHSSQPERGRSATDLCVDALARLSGERGFMLFWLAGGDLVNRVATSCDAVIGLDERPEVPADAVEPADARAGSAEAQVTIEPAEIGHLEVVAPALVSLLLEVRASTRRLRDDLRRHVVEGFDPAWSTVNNGLLRLDAAGLRHVADVRRLPGEGPQRAVDEHLHRLRGAAQASGCGVSVEKVLDSPPFSAAADSRTAAALTAVLNGRGMSTEPEYKSGTTEASVYGAEGIDTVVFGPGAAAGNIHRPNESVPLRELEEAVGIYADVVRRLCGA